MKQHTGFAQKPFVVGVFAVAGILAVIAGSIVAQQQPPTDTAPQTFRVVAEDTGLPLARASAETFRDATGHSILVDPRRYDSPRLHRLLNGDAQALLTTRLLTREETDQVIRETGKAPSVAVIARDAVSVYVYRNNPVDKLTLAQLRGIFTGDLKKWSDLGHPQALDKPFIAYAPPKDSETAQMFKNRVMQGRDFGPDVKFVTTAAEIIDRVPDDPDIVGFGSVAFGHNNGLIGVAEISGTADARVTHVANATTVGGDAPAYPLIQPLYIYTVGRPTGAVKQWIDWLVSEQGQAKLTEWGYFPLR